MEITAERKAKMKAERYLVLVHFASKLTRSGLIDAAPQIAASIRGTLQDAEAILTSDAAVGFVGMTTASPSRLFRDLSAGLARGDNLSIFAMGRDIVTSHPGLAAWQKNH